MNTDNQIVWNSRCSVYRPSLNFSDLQKIVSCYYEMYYNVTKYVSPYIARHSGKIFISPSKEDIKSALGKERSEISFKARSCFIDAVLKFLDKHKGTRTLIDPSPSSHHSAQFPSGTFTISLVDPNEVLIDDRQLIRKKANTLHKIDFFGAAEPVYIENLALPINTINFIILRPKMGRMGIPCVSQWEVLLCKKHHNYLIDHYDSDFNPKYAGKLN